MILSHRYFINVDMTNSSTSFHDAVIRFCYDTRNRWYDCMPIKVAKYIFPRLTSNNKFDSRVVKFSQ